MSEGLNNNINNNNTINNSVNINNTGSFPVMPDSLRSAIVRRIRENDRINTQNFNSRIAAVAQNPNHVAYSILNPELVRSFENAIQNNQENNVGNRII